MTPVFRVVHARGRDMHAPRVSSPAPEAEEPVLPV